MLEGKETLFIWFNILSYGFPDFDKTKPYTSALFK